MSKARDLADLMSSGTMLSDGILSTTEIDGVTATAAEINKLDGVTATTAELNILSGVTATAAEINKLDGVTATTAELNHVNGVTSSIQSQLDAKAGTLPSQTDNSGKFLTTDGTNPTWGTVVQGSGGGSAAEIADYVIPDATETNYVFKYYEIVPTTFTVPGTWQGISSSATLHVADVSSIDTDGEYFETDTTLSGNHIFYDILYIADAATLTVPSSYVVHGVKNLVSAAEAAAGQDRFQSTGKLIFLGVL